jgi:hypothetical protein
MTPIPEDMAYAKSIVEAVEQAEPLYEDKCLAVRDLLMRHRLAAEERGAKMVLEAAAKRVENHMADCLEDHDIQRRWKQIKATNDIYATAIRQIDPAALGAE